VDAHALGDVELDDAANQACGPRVSTCAGRFAAWVITTNGELMIARHTLELLGHAHQHDATGEVKMKLWIENIAAEATSDDLKVLLLKYGGPGFDAMVQVPGDGSRPGVLLTFDSASAEVLRRLANRLNGLYWKRKGLAVHVMLH
jgi:hypothetical protein